MFRIQSVLPMALLLTLMVWVSLPAGATVLSVSPAGLTNNVMVGSTPTSQTFEVINADADTYDYAVTITNEWLLCSSNAGTLWGVDTNVLSLTYSNTAGWAPGASNATIKVATTNDPGATQEVAILLNVMELTRSPATLTANVMQGQNASNQTFTVVNSGAGELAYTIETNVAWLSVSNVSGVVTGQAAGATNTITVRFFTSGLAAGASNATITVKSTTGGGSTQTVGVVLKVMELTLSPASLTNNIMQGQNATNQTFTVVNSGAGELAYTIETNVAWLSVSNVSGVVTGQAAGATNTITVRYLTSGFGLGVSNATITVTSTNGGGSTQTVAVVVNVMALIITPATLTNSVMQGHNASDQTFTVVNAGAGPLAYTIATNAAWLSVSNVSGVVTGQTDGGTNTITVRYLTSGLATGLTNATITVTSTNGGGSTQTVGVVLKVMELTLSPVTLMATCMQGQNASNQTFTVINSGAGELAYTIATNVAWLSVSNVSGVVTGQTAGATNTITVRFLTSSLVAGLFNATITVKSATGGGSTQTVAVVLNVMELSLSPVTLTATCMQGHNASNQTFTLVNSGAGELAYTIATNVAWLSVSNVSGVLIGQTVGGTNTITVRFLTSGLEVGFYAGAITITPVLGGGSKVLDVNLTVNARPELVVNPGAINVTVVQGQDAAGQVLTVSNTSAYGYAFTYTAAVDKVWLSMAGPYGSGSMITGQLAAGAANVITVNCIGVSGFSVGTSNGTLTVTAVDSDGIMVLGSPASVGVQVEVRSCGMGVSPTAFTDTIQQGYNVATQRLDVWRSGAGTNLMNYQISDNVHWLMVVPSEGVSTGEHDTVDVIFSTTGFNVGVSNAVITVVGLDNYGSWRQTSQVTVAVTVKPVAVLGCDGVTTGVTNRQGQGSISRSFSVWNDSVTPIGGEKGGLNWTVTANASWLSVSPAVGRSTGDKVTTTVRFDVTGLSPGSYRGLVTVVGVDEVGGGSAIQSPKEIVMEMYVEGTKGLDFFGDGVGAELVVYGDVNGWWQIKRLSDGCVTNMWFGGEGYQPVPGDYNGDGRVELALYRAASASWYIKELGSDTITELHSWGGIDYAPVVGDYDGDGHADYALYAENNGMWYILKSSDGGVLSGQFGGPGYQALAGDFDGDEVSDAALYDTRSGNWYIITVNSVVIAWNLLWGGEGFTPIVGDYDGNGHMDVGAYHEETGLWFAKSVEGDVILWWVPWGEPGFKPVSGDYNGDGVTELSVYQRSSGLWYILTAGGSIYQYALPLGGPSYMPVGQ